MKEESLPQVHFEKRYAGRAPWDIPRAQQSLVGAEAQITGRVLDSGCGTGENAIYFAARGCDVLGVDIVEEAIRRANVKAAERGSTARFEVRDALTYSSWAGKGAQFDAVLDSGVFHVFNDKDRATYVEGLSYLTKPGGRLFLICFSDAEPGTVGPRRVSKDELESAFSQSWIIESITPTQYELVSGGESDMFTPGGAKAWFMIARRR